MLDPVCKRYHDFVLFDNFRKNFSKHVVVSKHCIAQIHRLRIVGAAGAEEVVHQGGRGEEILYRQERAEAAG